MIGKIINNYLIVRKLGSGGMGDVYYAKHNKIDREVAIKVLHNDLFSNENIHNRFKNEANALIRLNHPNIVKIYDYLEQDNFACLIMEYFDGHTLDEYITNLTGPLPSVKATSIITSILDAVQYAHDNNVYHRDIKPANIMMSKDGSKVRIMDFGIAKLTDSQNYKTTHANTQLGTPFYMSPEQIKGLPYSRMSDIYSIGVTLFEMVTGKCPYHQITSLFELQLKIVNEPLPNTDDYYPGVSIRLQNAIIKATQKNPELRFQNCNEFKRYLEEGDAYVSSSNYSNPSISKQTKKKTNWPVYVLSSFALIFLITLGTAYITKKTPIAEQTDISKSIAQPPTDTSKNEILPPTANEKPDSIKPKSIEEQNLTILDLYIDRKQNETDIRLSSKQKSKITKEIKKYDRLITFNDIKKYNRYFEIPKKIPDKIPEVSKVIPLTKNQVYSDFWSEIHKKKVLYRVIFEKDSQISDISCTDPLFDSKNPPNDIIFTVNYKIASLDDEELEKTAGSAILHYSRIGNEYKLKN